MCCHRRNIGQCLALFIRKHGSSGESGNSSRSKLAHNSSLTSLAPYANVVGCTTSRRLQLDACYAVQYTLRCNGCAGIMNKKRHQCKSTFDDAM